MGILFQTFNRVLIIAQYYANQEYIAKNICENRDKPKMHCNGKCHLKKQLAKEEKEQSPSPRSQKSEEVVTLFSSHNLYTIIEHVNIATRKSYFTYNDMRTAFFLSSVFHPPSA